MDAGRGATTIFFSFETVAAGAASTVAEAEGPDSSERRTAMTPALATGKNGVKVEVATSAARRTKRDVRATMFGEDS